MEILKQTKSGNRKRRNPNSVPSPGNPPEPLFIPASQILFFIGGNECPFSAQIRRRPPQIHPPRHSPQSARPPVQPASERASLPLASKRHTSVQSPNNPPKPLFIPAPHPLFLIGGNEYPFSAQIRRRPQQLHRHVQRRAIPVNRQLDRIPHAPFRNRPHQRVFPVHRLPINGHNQIAPHS